VRSLIAATSSQKRSISCWGSLRGRPAIASMQRTRTELLAQRPINRGDRHIVEIGAAKYQVPPLGRSSRQTLQPPAQRHQDIIGGTPPAHVTR